MTKMKGLTLIEVLILIVILSVMASLVIPRFRGQDERGIVAEATGMLSAIRQAEAAYYLENSAYTATLANLDVDTSPSTKFSYAVAAATGTATATRLPASGVCGPTTYQNCTITLTAAGAWGGTHPFKPQ